MSGLVGYGSSDEDEDDLNNQRSTETKKPSVLQEKTISSTTQSSHKPYVSSITPAQGATSPNTAKEHRASAAEAPDVSVTQGPVSGPAAAPQNGPAGSVEEQNHESNQTMVMNLTLPPVPNFDIPDSPPGSPDPSVVAKLAQFAQLKKQGVHFNEKLANSTAIKNPNLFSKLLDSFGISEAEQYATTLPTSIWDHTTFPDWAYKEELAKAQAEANQRRRQAGSGSAKLVDHFVSASNNSSTTNRSR